MQFAGRRILILEDEFILALEIQEVLEEAGAEVIGPASTIEKALQMIDNGSRIDAAILDLNVNGRLSTPVAEALGRLSVPYLFATGYGPDHSAVSGAVCVLTKPYMPDQLLKAVQRLLGEFDGTPANLEKLS
jgi:CheY-like chemotaxis protein